MRLLLLLSGLLAAVLAQTRTESEWIDLAHKINATAAELRETLNEFDEYALWPMKLYYKFESVHDDLMRHPFLKLIKVSANHAEYHESEEHCKTLTKDKLTQFVGNLKKKTSLLQRFGDFYRSTFPIMNGVLKEIEDDLLTDLRDQIDNYCKNTPDLPECWINHAPRILNETDQKFTKAAGKLIQVHRQLPKTLGKILLSDNAANFKKEVLKPVRDCWVDNFPLNRLIENFQSIMSLSLL